jgi:hypothetical protein
VESPLRGLLLPVWRLEIVVLGPTLIVSAWNVKSPE